MKNLLPLLLLLLVSQASSIVGAQETNLDPSIAKWEEDIVKLEGLGLTEPKVDKPILYCGSSSIRLWETMAGDMAPWPGIRRGFGGSRLPDLIHYAPRIVGPHLGMANPNRCRAVVIFVANDVAGSDSDVTPTEVANRFSRLHSWIRQQDQTIPVFWIEVTPTRKRWAVWPKIAEATRQINQMIDTDDNSHFIATAGAYLGLDGRPRPELFVADQLHLSTAGYQLWASLIKAQLHLQLEAIVPWEKPVPKPKLNPTESQQTSETLPQAQ